MIVDKTTIKGIWWLENEPAKKLQGQVTYGPTSGAEVDLFGLLYDSFDDKKLLQRVTLHGLTFKTKPVSLFETMYAGGEMNLPGGASSRLRSCSGVVGGHYRSLEEIAFKNVHVNFKGLIDWTCTTGTQIKPDEKPQGFAVNYRLPPAVPLGRYGAFSLRLEFTGHLQPGFHGFGFTEDCVLVVEADQMRPYVEFEEQILIFQRFLSLAIQRPVQATQIIGHVDNPREVIQNTPIFEDFLVIREVVLPEWSRDLVIPHDLLFALPELGGSPEKVFGRFVERKKVLLAAMDLYFSTVYNERQIPRVDFLTLAQGLEAYHRATIPPGKYMSDERYEAGLRKALLDAIPRDDPLIDPDFRSSLKNKLKYLHEFSLNKRLREIARRHTSVLEPLIGKPEDFSKAVSDLRNELTHPGEGNSDAEADYHRLLHLSEQMALLLEVCFLDEMGFPQEQIKAIIFNRSQRANRIHRGWV